MTQTMTPVQAQPVYEISDADRARQQLIADAIKAYEGDFDKPLKPMPGQADDNVLSNRMKAIVDRGVDFLFGKELQISVEEDAPEDAQKALDDTFGRKEQRMPMLQKLGMNGAFAGQAFLRIVPENDGTIRLVVVDPSTIFMQSAPQDCDTVLLYCIEYSTTEKVNGHPQSVYYREEISRVDPDQDGGEDDSDAYWIIQHWSRVGDRGPWSPAGEPYIWPYTFAPVFDCQNLPKPNDRWGYPDITPDLIGMNESLNLDQSNINRILKIFGAPILWAKGMGTSEDIIPGRFTVLSASPDAGMGSVPIPSDIANARAFAADLRSDIDEQSSVPGVATGRIADLPRGQISGVAIELLFMPLLLKTEKKRCTYGELLLDVCAAIFIMKGINKDIKVNLPWSSPLPHDDLQNIQAATLKKGIGVSDTTLLEELGYDPKEELARNQAEDALKMPMLAAGQATPPAGQPNQPVQAQDQAQGDQQQAGGQ